MRANAWLRQQSATIRKHPATKPWTGQIKDCYIRPNEELPHGSYSVSCPATSYRPLWCKRLAALSVRRAHDRHSARGVTVFQHLERSAYREHDAQKEQPTSYTRGG